MDGVAVTGGGRVLADAAQVHRQHGVRWRRGRILGGGTARFVGQAGALLLEECRGLHRDNLCADGEFADHVHQQTLAVLSQVLRVGGDGQRLVDTDLALALDLVADVHRTDCTEREFAGGHDLHGQRELQHEQVRQRQRRGEPLAGGPAIRLQRIGIDAHVDEPVVGVGHRRGRGDLGGLADHGQHRRDGLAVDRGGARGTAQCDRLTHHAPRKPWPHTRTMLPVTAFDAGLAK